MKKYRINWLTVLRNVGILTFLATCNIANAQTEYINTQLQEEPKQVIIQAEINHLEIIEDKAEIEPEKEYLGTFKITHYCACKKCCGPNAKGITASGKKVEENKTIAVDPKVIKLGSNVYIDGYGEYEAQDTGSAIKGNIIDIYVADHNQALKMGVAYKDVYLIK